MGAYTFADPVSGAPSFTGTIFRSLLSVFVGGKTGTRPMGGRSGVSAGIPSTIATVAMPNYTVTPFTGYLDTSAGSGDGGTPFAFTTNQTGTVTAAHATLERIDLLFVRLDDPAEGDGTANPLPVVGYLAGTAASAGSQVAPATPARAFPLAQINVPHSGSGSPTVTWVAPYVVAAGGVLPCTSTTYPASPHVGDVVSRIDAAARLEVWGGSGWLAVNEAPPAWQSITTFTAGASAGTPGPQARLWANGRVEVRGVINATTFFAASGVQLATLPAGMAPAATRRFTPTRNFASANAGDCRCEVRTDGTLWLYTVASTTAWIDLSNAEYWLA